MSAVRIVDEHLLAPVLVYSGSGGVFDNELVLNVEDGLVKEVVDGQLVIRGYKFESDLQVSLGDGRSFGRYASGETIPATGKTPAELIQMAIVQPIDPTVTLTSSTTIAFNQTSINNVLNFSHVINSLNESVATATLQWRRGSSGGYTTLSSSLTGSGTYTHSLTDTDFNTESFYYQYVVTDSVGASATANLSITPASYVAPSISLNVTATSQNSPETALKREKGNISSNLAGTVTRNSLNVPLVNYTLQCSTDNLTWQNVGATVAAGPGSFAIPSTNHNDSSLKNTSEIYYRVKVMDDYQVSLGSSGIVGGNKTVRFLNVVFYGPASSDVLTSSAARNLSARIFSDGDNPFDLQTGSTDRRYTVALPRPSEITLVNDVDALNAEITTNYIPVESGPEERVYVYAVDSGNPVTSVPTSVLSVTITAVAAGNNFVLALDSTGRVHAWGSNDQGQTDVPAGALSGVTKITAGIGFAYVLKSDGTVLGWGNSDGQRFDYTGLTGVTDLFSGWYETLFIKGDGSVIRRGSSTGVNPAFNISGWTSGVNSVAAGRYNLIANQNGYARVTGHSNHEANTTPTQAQTGVVSVHANGGTTLWARKADGTIIGWGKADSGEMSELHAIIGNGELPGVTSTYSPDGARAVMVISDPTGVIDRFIPTQGYQLGVLTAAGDVIITGLGNLPDATLPGEVSSNVTTAAIGAEFIVTVGPNNDRSFFIDDAGGTPTLYNVYTMTNAIPYSENHRHRVTRG